jgi:hypothetical protein
MIPAEVLVLPTGPIIKDINYLDTKKGSNEFGGLKLIAVI